MTKTKLVLATAVAAVLAFGVAACGPQAETAPEEAPAVTEPAPPAADPAAVAPPTDPAAVPAPTDPAAAPAPAPAEAPK
jgi:hypothetical protein